MEKSKPMMIIIIVLLVVLVGIIVGASFYIVSNLNKGSVNTEQTAPPTDASLGEPKNLTPDKIDTVNLSQPINTNLLPEKEGESRAVRISLSIGIDNTDSKNSKKFIELLQSREAVIRDTALSVLRNKTASELNAGDSKDILADEILVELQEVFQSELIVKVYISDIYIP